MMLMVDQYSYQLEFTKIYSHDSYVGVDAWHLGCHKCCLHTDPLDNRAKTCAGCTLTSFEGHDLRLSDPLLIEKIEQILVDQRRWLSERLAIRDRAAGLSMKTL